MDCHQVAQRRMVTTAAQSGPAGTSAPRFSQVKGPYAVNSLPVVNVPLGPSPIDPTSALQLQLEVLTPQCEFTVQLLWQPVTSTGYMYSVCCSTL